MIGKENINNLNEISIDHILQYKKERNGNGDYSLGGIYLIYDSVHKKGYVGKSINVIKRLKSHLALAKSNKGICIDKTMHGRLSDFKFFILSKYDDLGIDFFNRKLESIIEHTLIGEYKTYYPFGYNIRYYEQLRIK